VPPPVEQQPKDTASGGAGGIQEPVSLDGCDLELVETMRIILKNWDKAPHCLDPMSLDHLNRQLLDILSQSDQKLGQVGQKRAHVTGWLDFPTH
jgi:hypothetical protein